MEHKMKPRSAPSHPVRAPQAFKQDPGPASLINRLAHEGIGPPDLSLAQVESYLKANGCSAVSLIAAYRVTNDEAPLREALERYPTDPKVCFAGYHRCPYDIQRPVAAEQRQWLEAFKDLTPDNPLGSYLLAREYFKAGQTDQAVQELQASIGKSKFDDYSAEFTQSAEEAWRAAGYSDAEAMVFASTGLRTQHITELRFLGKNLIQLANDYRQAGDQASAQATLQIALTLGQQLDQPASPGFVQNLIGLEMQKNALSDMDPAGPYGKTGQIVQGRLEEISRRHDSLCGMGQQWLAATETLPEEDLATFFQRQKAAGSEGALRWFVSKQSPPR